MRQSSDAAVEHPTGPEGNELQAYPIEANEPVTEAVTEGHDDFDDAVHDASHESRQKEEADAPTSFFSAANIKVALVPTIGGTLNGYTIGYVGIYTQMYKTGSDCSVFRGGQTACETVPFADCRWESTVAGPQCGWASYTCRTLYPNEEFGGTADAARAGCLSDSRCQWSYSKEECQNPFGYSSSFSGIFAGSMILGCMFGAMFSGPIVPRVGSKVCFLLIGIVSVVCSIMYHIACSEDEFWVLIVARFVIGIFIGMTGVACPLYVDQNGHPKYKRIIGVFFQVFTTFGIFVAATIGLGVGQSVQLSQNKDQRIMARMQGIAAGSTAVSLLMIWLGIVSDETSAKFSAVAEEEDGKEGKANNDTQRLNADEYGWFEMLPRLLMGIVMAGTLQLTGINAVMNYAPTIMGSLNLAPLVGNFIVMVWNFVTTFGSIPLASIFTMRQLFLAGSLFTSSMCLFLCGVPVYPGVSSETVKNGVAITGILLFIMGYEFAVGPCYFVLTQDMFPPSFRPKGCAFTQAWQFIFTVIINICYPIATEDISGGAAGNQDKGQAIAFIFFGCLGMICFIIQIFFLHPWEGEETKARGDGTASDANAPTPEHSADRALVDKEPPLGHRDLDYN